MNSSFFLLGTILLLGLSWLLMRNTEPFCDCGPGSYEWRRFRRLVGKILLVTAALMFVIAGFALCVSAGGISHFLQN